MNITAFRVNLYIYTHSPARLLWVPRNEFPLGRITGSWFLWKYYPNKEICGGFFILPPPHKSSWAEATKFSVRGQLVNISGLVSHMVNVCHNHSTPPWSLRTTNTRAVWLCFCKSWFMNTEIWILRNFHTSWNSASFFNLFQPFQNVKTTLGSSTIQELIWGCVRSKGK